jgi:acyl-CoA hydrolase
MSVELALALKKLMRPGMEVFVAGCAGESQALLNTLTSNSHLARGVRFTGVQIPTVNRFSYAELTPSTRQRCFFLSPELRAAFKHQRVEYLPLSYTAIWQWLERQSFDLVIFQGAKTAQGINLSISADFTTAALKHARTSLALANTELPETSAPTIAFDRLTQVIETSKSVLHYDAGSISPSMSVLAEQVAALIPNGAVVQFGLGKLQKALLKALRHHRGLRIHSGMVSSGLLDLSMAGALAPWDKQSPPVTCGVALGSQDLYDQAAEASFIRFMPVGYTHSAQTLASIANFVSVNSILEVDLTGQVNAESLDGEQISGGGGLADFVLGARLAWSGQSILATPASAEGGTKSRICVQLAPHTPVTVPRHEVDIIVTEFGSARLRGLSIDERAQALIAIADPQFREDLEREWSKTRSKM